MNSIGTLLKEARTKKSVSLDEVHAKIKVHPRVLQLLEDGKFEKLPSPLFVKSFLRSYAEFLEISPEELIQAYEKEDRKEPEQVLFLKTPEERKKIAVGSSGVNWQALLVPVVILAAFIAAGVFLWNNAGAILSKMNERKTSSPVLKPKPSSRPAVSVSAAAPAEESPKMQAPWLRAPEQGNFPKIAGKAPLEIRVRALDTVWLRVTSDEKVLFQSILQKGVSETWKANDTIEIWTGNASSMELSLNRHFLGSPGKGVAKKLLISREGVKLTQKI